MSSLKENPENRIVYTDSAREPSGIGAIAFRSLTEGGKGSEMTPLAPSPKAVELLAIRGAFNFNTHHLANKSVFTDSKDAVWECERLTSRNRIVHKTKEIANVPFTLEVELPEER